MLALTSTTLVPVHSVPAPSLYGNHEHSKQENEIKFFLSLSLKVHLNCSMKSFQILQMLWCFGQDALILYIYIYISKFSNAFKVLDLTQNCQVLRLSLQLHCIFIPDCEILKRKYALFIIFILSSSNLISVTFASCFCSHLWRSSSKRIQCVIFRHLFCKM